MRGIIIRTDEMPEEIDLALDERGSALGSLQKAVGGCIEPFNILFNGGIDLYINDEGLFTCPPNRAIYATEAMEETGYLSQLDYATPVKEGELYTILHGDIVAVGYDTNTGSSRDLTDDEMREVTEYFTNHSAPGSGFIETLLVKGGAYDKEQGICTAEQEMSLDAITAMAMNNIDMSATGPGEPSSLGLDQER